MAPVMVREHQSEHRLADRHGADADAGIVPALGDEVDVLAAPRDAPLARSERESLEFDSNMATSGRRNGFNQPSCYRAQYVERTFVGLLR